MIERRLARQLEKVARRLRYRRLLWSWSALWLIMAAVTGAVVCTAWIGIMEPVSWVNLLSGLAILLGLAALWRTSRAQFTPLELAQRIERRFPDLRASLLTAIDQQPTTSHGRLGYMQQRVVEQAVRHAYGHSWQQIVPGWQILLAALSNGLGLALFVGGLFVLLTADDARSIRLRTLAPTTDALTRSIHVPTIEPGSIEVERNSSLLVLARFADELPADARLSYRFSDGESGQVGMLKSLDDPVFGGRVPAVRERMEYQVEYAGQTTETYTVTVFEYPRLVRADGLLEFPQYTAWEPRRVEDTRRISAVEGTQLTLTCLLNKSVASARLIAADGTSMELKATSSLPDPTASASTSSAAALSSAKTADPAVTAPAETNLTASLSNPNTGAVSAASVTPPVSVTTADDSTFSTPTPIATFPYAVTWKLVKSEKYNLELIDAAGRRNQQQVELIITVLPNRPPDLKLVAPARDLQVSPLEEMDLRANVWDDFGVNRFGVQFALAGQESRELVLAESVAGRVRQEVQHTLALETLKAAPDELLSYHFWAEDLGPDGTVRRTSSDMYFAEVRHFEEIFRQGQQPTADQQQQSQEQQQSGAAAQAEELAELQKQIINATWNVLRRETATPPTAAFVTDARSLVESQQQAREKLDELISRLQDPGSKAHAEMAAESMRQAEQRLQEAVDQGQMASLNTALAAEQAAYQGLLKLRAREHEVVRSNSRSSSSSRASSASSRTQQQLQQLQLREDENRYETEDTARNQQEQAVEDRETRQVLNRLRELAQRQTDLNERLKELNAALQEAENEQEREEIRQQLKRLREEQQQILRDAEELQSRMEQPSNQERMQSAQERLSETRENLREASQALEEGQVSRAISSGTRAELTLETLRDEFRQQAAGRFDEEMRELQQRAKELDETQQQLAEQLQNATKPPAGQPSLRDSGQRAEIQQELQQQQKRLDELTQRMTETVTEAESNEPLLANALYETLRQTQQRQVNEALRATERSLSNGLLDDAKQQEQVAQQGIRDLRAGVDRAAETVLGDEAEALQLARDQLNQLIDQVQSEVAQARPDLASDAANESVPTGESQQSPAERDPSRQTDAASRAADGQQPEATDQPRGEPSANSRAEQAKAANLAEGGQRPNRQATSDQPRRSLSEENNDASQPGNRPSANAPGQPGQQQQAGQQQQPGQPAQEPGQQEPGQQQPGQGRGTANESAANQPGPSPPSTSEPSGGEQRRAASPDGPGQTPGANRMPGGNATGLGGLTELLGPVGRGGPEVAPLTGESFREWSDRLRDVEEMIGDPELSAEAARIRDRARGFRQDFRRHSADPNWDLVQLEVVQPLVELRDRVMTELLKRTSPEALVPIDRDPVPPRFSDPVRKYFERLGTGR